MMRWLLRLSVGALLAALLFWLWNRFNQDLVEEEELDDEIPFEFDVPLEAEDSGLALRSTAPMGSDDANGLATSVGTLTTMPAEAATDGAAQEPPSDGPSAAITDATLSADGSLPTVSANGDGGHVTAVLDTDSQTSMPAEAAAVAPVEDAPADDSTLADDGEEPEVAKTPPSKGSQEGWDPHEQDAKTGDAPPPGAGDNLIVIKGIGKATSTRLGEMGITTYGALIATPVDLLIDAFPRVSAAEIESWITQARELSGQES
jgi:predicted flap endonuclease-1-like 5' DNA nuclease